MSVNKKRPLNKKKSIFEAYNELIPKARELAAQHKDIKPIKYLLK